MGFIMLKTENIINGFADVILFVIFQFLICAAYSAEYFSTPIDFGSATYQLSGGGFSNIAVTDAGVISTSGSGNLFNQTGGAAGNFAITNWETFEWRVILTVNEPGAGNYTITTPGCCSVT